MKAFALVLVFAATSMLAAESSSQPAAPAPDPYAQFLARLFTRESIGELASVADAVIDAIDRPDAPAHLPGPRSADTKTGVHLEFGCVPAQEATLYYISLSRNGDPLRYSDAVRLMAFFTDRAGLPHPITVKEGERPVFFAEWVFKPSDWKKERKLMLKLREQNRAEKDPLRAFAIAVSRELEARQTAPRD